MPKQVDFHVSLVVNQWGILKRLLHDADSSVNLDGKGLEIPHVVYVSRWVAQIGILDVLRLITLQIGMRDLCASSRQCMKPSLKVMLLFCEVYPKEM